MNSFCTNCGAAVTPGAAFCAQCGAAIQGAGAPQPEPAMVQPPAAYGYPPQQPGSRISPRAVLFGAIGVGVLGLVTVLLVVLLGGNGPEDVVEDVFEAHLNSDCDRVVELTYFDENSANTREEALEGCADGDDVSFTYKILGTRDYDRELPDGVDDAAYVKVRVTAAFFGSETDDVTVFKVDGDWLVYEGADEDE